MSLTLFARAHGISPSPLRSHPGVVRRGTRPLALREAPEGEFCLGWTLGAFPASCPLLCRFALRQLCRRPLAPSRRQHRYTLCVLGRVDVLYNVHGGGFVIAFDRLRIPRGRSASPREACATSSVCVVSILRWYTPSGYIASPSSSRREQEIENYRKRRRKKAQTAEGRASAAVQSTIAGSRSGHCRGRRRVPAVHVWCSPLSRGRVRSVCHSHSRPNTKVVLVCCLSPFPPAHQYRKCAAEQRCQHIMRLARRSSIGPPSFKRLPAWPRPEPESRLWSQRVEMR